jgi:hypothetical protein
MDLSLEVKWPKQDIEHSSSLSTKACRFSDEPLLHLKVHVVYCLGRGSNLLYKKILFPTEKNIDLGRFRRGSCGEYLGLRGRQ